MLTLRFGLDDEGPHSIKEVAERLEVNYARVKNTLFSALTKMRRPHVALALRDYLEGDDDEMLQP